MGLNKLPASSSLERPRSPLCCGVLWVSFRGLYVSRALEASKGTSTQGQPTALTCIQNALTCIHCGADHAKLSQWLQTQPVGSVVIKMVLIVRKIC